VSLCGGVAVAGAVEVCLAPESEVVLDGEDLASWGTRTLGYPKFNAPEPLPLPPLRAPNLPKTNKLNTTTTATTTKNKQNKHHNNNNININII